MTLVLVERRFPEPVAFETIQDLEVAGAWCLRAHNVTYLKTFFSRTRKRMLCLYEAPDAEAVRKAERQAAVPFDRAWACLRVGLPEALRSGPPPNETGEHVIMEREFDPPVPPDYLDRATARERWCLDTHRAAYVETYLSLDGRRMVCHFRAPDAESVRRANRMMGMVWIDSWPATVHGP